MNEIKELTNLIVSWANTTFPERTPQSAFLKLFEEIGELVKNPDSGGEYADVFIILLDLAHMHHIDIKKAVSDKICINQSRRWSFSKLGTLQHTAPANIDNNSQDTEQFNFVNENAYWCGVHDLDKGYQKYTSLDPDADIDAKLRYEQGYISNFNLD